MSGAARPAAMNVRRDNCHGFPGGMTEPLPSRFGDSGRLAVCGGKGKPVCFPLMVIS
jgi:hypothetical protein